MKTNVTPDKAKQKVNVVDPGTVNELTLAPRQPGENFDTYLGSWGGVSVKMQGTPVWDHDKYPNLVNGVPCMGQGYGVGDQNQITTSSAGGQDFFIVYVATASFDAYVLNFKSNVSSLASAYNNMLPNSPIITMPVASDFVKVTYGDGSTGFVAVTGKLIRITTGTSHFAFATVGYPTPAPVLTTPPTTYTMSFIYPAGSNYEYDVNVTNGVITSIGGLNIATYQNFPAHYNSGGTWTPIAGTTHYHITGLNVTGTPTANTPVTFTFTGDTSDSY
ncbi:hypothetical protein [Mucilaginibacter lappiensis]|uniref:Uncharacterized protein n=1 Tax=Mucilaginibacter lappiensis TaxID=354630 RepID=A0A841JLN3_9SPHI|nr:hypothetical protein [Mucilaginibacter lappiensis]MBB6129275.1 hypothetical protein [Mucilaginibacter lappiensis]